MSSTHLAAHSRQAVRQRRRVGDLERAQHEQWLADAADHAGLIDEDAAITHRWFVMVRSR